MTKLWLIARHEYRKTASKRSFLLGTLAIPVGVVLLFTLIYFVTIRTMSGDVTAPLGYVDQSGAIRTETERAATPDSVGIVRFETLDSAANALASGKVQAYFVLAPDYLSSGSVELYYKEQSPSSDVRATFESFMRDHLLTGLPAAEALRIDQGINLTLRSADGSRQMRTNSVVEAVFPFLAAMLFVFTVLMSTGYLLQAVASEKENRTIEIMSTTLSPLQLVGGKALGLLGVVLTQLVIWLGAIAVGVAIGSRFLPELQGLVIPWSMLGVVMLYFVPSYALVAGMMTALGISVTEYREAQQVSGLLNMLFMLPLFFAALLYSHPDSPLMVALTLFPTTAFMTVALRWSMTSIPMWQLVTSWSLVTVSAILTVIGASRIFRVGMLRYGKQLSLAEMFSAASRRGNSGQRTGR